MATAVTYEAVRAALGEVLPKLTGLLRQLAESPRSAVGRWTVPDVACHLSHVLDIDTKALEGGLLPSVEPTPAGVAAWNSSMLTADPERHLATLADRIDARAASFLEHTPTATATEWLFGLQLSPASVACHLLAEVLLHGHDIAQASESTWRIEPAHAALAIVGGGVPIINACPDLWLRHPEDTRARARVELRLRGHQRLTLVLDPHLRAEVPPDGPADAYLLTSADQALLIFFGRRSPWRVAATGHALVWGLRPWALFTLLGAITSP